MKDTNSKTKFVLIGGKARHGKDTAGAMFAASLRQSGQRVLLAHYADLLKFMCKNYFGWDGMKDNAGRALLQRVGTDVVRQQKPDFWVDFIIDLVTLFPNAWDYVVIPDTRFPNEINRIREAGFDATYVRVVREHFDNGLTEEQKQHPSEIALDAIEPDVLLFNTSLHKLEGRVRRVCAKLVGGKK